MTINQGSQANIHNRLRSKISSFSINKEGLYEFCKLLQERSNAAGEIESRLFDKGKRTDEEYKEALITLRESFKLHLTVSGFSGEELYGSIDDVFGSVNFPKNVKGLFVNSAHILKDRHSYNPQNSFMVYLDFSKPEIFDFSLMPSQGTPNESNFEVQGRDATWVNGVFSEINKFLKQYESKLSFVHNHSIYDVLLWVFGFPIAFQTCYKLSFFIESAKTSAGAFFSSALYFYCFIAVLFLFRILFHYLRWICPLVEYKTERGARVAHRVFLASIFFALIKTYVVDFTNFLFKAFTKV